jgi:hypothetical protein
MFPVWDRAKERLDRKLREFIIKDANAWDVPLSAWMIKNPALICERNLGLIRRETW